MKLKFLIVDDEEAIGIVLKKMLLKRNIVSVLVGEYGAAIEALKKETFDLVLIDRWLNGVDGTFIVDELKKLGKNKQTPVIVMTGSDDMFQSTDSKFLGCIKKPFEFSELEKAANKVGLFF